jgi:UDP-MurNAc hydroxylase
MPGDQVSVNTKLVEETAYTEKVTEQDFERYISAYALRYKDFFANRKNGISNDSIVSLQTKLITELTYKLEKFIGREKINRPFFVGFLDVKAPFIKIDFEENQVSLEDALPTSQYYLMRANSYDLEPVLNKQLSWEDFSLTFRMRLNREPDIYQVLMQGFMILEAEDLERFCNKIMEIENRRERIVLDAGGCKFSMDKYCPHQGADLSEGWVEDNRYLVCPRHGWKFDLLDEGNSKSTSSTINAIQLDE